MKTLDEVIENFEKACDLERRCENCSGCLSQENGCPYDGAESVPDALFYLKEYRDDKDEIDSTRLAYLDILTDYVALKNYWAEQQENEPLTWDELKTMEGKPVWVEVDGKWWGRFWAFVEVKSDSYIDFFQKGQDYPEDLWKRDMGKTWNAFRKERK